MEKIEEYKQMISVKHEEAKKIIKDMQVLLNQLTAIKGQIQLLTEMVEKEKKPKVELLTK